jgi:DNA-binding Lrp family transcriptional regulator
LPQKIEVEDEIRLNILKSMLEKGVVQPNLLRIKSKTKYHLATIKSSIDFLEKSQVIVGFGPKISFSKLSFKIEIIELLQLDFSNQSLIEKYLSTLAKDTNVWEVHSIMGSGNFNIIVYRFHADVESYHKNLQEKYIKKIQNYYDVVKDKQVFYLTSPTYKKTSRTNSIISALLEKHGLNKLRK